MTKKNFIALAEVLAQYQGLQNHLNQAFNIGASTIQANSDKAMSLLAVKDAAYRELAETLASFCSTQNPNFNRERFLAACGVE